jgi:hypothetical protein
VTLSFTSVLPLMIVACKKPPPAVVDAGPPPEVVVDAAPAILTALDEDAGQDAADASDGHRHPGTGTGLNTNQVRAKQCCAALRSQAKQLGASPEANMILTFAATCDQLAVQVGPTSSGQAPELAPLRQMLKGRNMPPVCQGL